MWRQWKTPRRRRAALLELGVRRGWQAIQPAADLALGILQRPKPYLSGFPMPISNRSGFLPWSRSDGATSRTAVYGPVRTVVWQGSAGNCCPYADQTGFPVTCAPFMSVGERADVPLFPPRPSPHQPDSRQERPSRGHAGRSESAAHRKGQYALSPPPIGQSSSSSRHLLQIVDGSDPRPVALRSGDRTREH